MPLGREVGLGLGHIVLDGDPAPLPPQKRGTAPIFGSCLLWPNGCMDQDATWYEGRPWPGQHCVGCGPSSTPLPKGHSPQFSAHVWVDQDATCYEGRPRPMPRGVRRRPRPSFPDPKRAQQPPPLFSAHVYGGHGRPSHLLVSSCYTHRAYAKLRRTFINVTWYRIY